MPTSTGTRVMLRVDTHGTHSTRQPKDPLQVWWRQDVPANDGCLEAWGIVFDAVKHWRKMKGLLVGSPGDMVANPCAAPGQLCPWVLLGSVCAFRTPICICISGLLVPGPTACQHGRGVLREEGHDVAAWRGQPWVQR